MKSVFKKSLPLISTVFVNKCGSLGLALVPMLLVEKHYSESNAAFVMTIIKISAVVGTLIGGILCDIWTMKTTLLFSFLLCALGLGILPYSNNLTFIIVSSAIAYIGSSLFSGPLRMLLTSCVEKSEQQEAWGWFRTSNNVGQIFSYLIGIFAPVLGVTGLMLINAFTNLSAATIGRLIIPDVREDDCKKGPEAEKRPTSRQWRVFFIFALITGGFSCLYDLFLVSVAANAKLYFKDQGVTVYSQIMLINTMLCGITAIFAARKIKNPSSAFPAGIVLLSLGSALCFINPGNKLLLFSGVLIVTMGEILYTALATVVLVRLTPNVHKKGSAFGLALVFQPIGRIIGAGLAFPMVVHGHHATMLPLLIGGLVLTTLFFIRKDITQSFVIEHSCG